MDTSCIGENLDRARVYESRGGDSVKLFGARRPLRYESTIGEQKQANIQLKAATTKNEYVSFRTKRDATLSTPKLLLPSVQININAGNLPKPENNNVSYLKIPLSL